MGRWARALGTGSLITPSSHALHIGPQNVGLGPLTERLCYAMGFGVTNGAVNEPVRIRAGRVPEVRGCAIRLRLAPGTVEQEHSQPPRLSVVPKRRSSTPAGDACCRQW
jgi:hypothetical protein